MFALPFENMSPGEIEKEVEREEKRQKIFFWIL